MKNCPPLKHSSANEKYYNCKEPNEASCSAPTEVASRLRCEATCHSRRVGTQLLQSVRRENVITPTRSVCDKILSVPQNGLQCCQRASYAGKLLCASTSGTVQVAEWLLGILNQRRIAAGPSAKAIKDGIVVRDVAGISTTFARIVARGVSLRLLGLTANLFADHLRVESEHICNALLTGGLENPVHLGVVEGSHHVSRA